MPKRASATEHPPRAFGHSDFGLCCQQRRWRPKSPPRYTPRHDSRHRDADHQAARSPVHPAAGASDLTNYLDVYRVYRGQVEHEDNLLGSRINVFVTSQSFLFAAYAIIANTASPLAFGAPIDPKHVPLFMAVWAYLFFKRLF